MIRQIILGGQTGADQGGLEAGKLLGILTGGTVPFGCRTEKGDQTALLRDTYNCIPNFSSRYPDRTRQNVLDGDGTVIFGNPNSPGSKLTLRLCRELNKPCLLLNDLNGLNRPFYAVIFLDWVKGKKIKVLNVAGNRESKNPGIQEKVKNFLVGVLEGG